MEYTYAPTGEIGGGDNQLYMYDCVQATTSRYLQHTSQNPISSSISFTPPVSHFPDANQCAIVAAGNKQQLNFNKNFYGTLHYIISTVS